MTKTASALLILLLVAACDARPPRSDPVPTPTPSTGFDNSAAAQSIMQPEVVAENPPAPTQSTTPTPATPRTVTITFAHGAALDDAGRAALDELAVALPGEARLIVRGHSDSPGSDAANLAQSRRRAEAVQGYLSGKGIAPARMEVIALGERRPIAPNANRDGSDDMVGRARNRRVEIDILPPAPASDLTEQSQTPALRDKDPIRRE